MKKTTKIKKLYYMRFVFRAIMFALAIFIYIFFPQTTDVMIGMNVFRTFNIMHLFLFVWLFDIITQLIPMTEHFSIGSLKHFKQYMKNAKIKDKNRHIRTAIQNQVKANAGAFKVLAIWLFLTFAIGSLKFFEIISHKEIFLISTFFYLCDLICVLFFCPFQKFFMHNKCCATCRIFNWDHLMMFSPFIFVKGAYTAILVLLSLISVIIWEAKYHSHPERFFEESNDTLKCKNCKERMCRKCI